ncbi:MAG: hypothetical protein Q7K40_00060 [bacterium]|nr:hypothetical protein [bacterium]
MEPNTEQREFSSLIERLMPKASIKEKEIAQANLNTFMEVMYRIYQRFEAEGRFPLPEDGSLTKSVDM